MKLEKLAPGDCIPPYVVPVNKEQCSDRFPISYSTESGAVRDVHDP